MKKKDEDKLKESAAASTNEQAELDAERKKCYKFCQEISGELVTFIGLIYRYVQIYKFLTLPSDVPILILGETGTGKEIVANIIHKYGNRKEKMLLTINCGQIPDTHLYTELFGHVKGAFTDAYKDKKGIFEQADGQTLFLDEIGELSKDAQKGLLRVIQHKEIVKLGDEERNSKKVDVKIIAATNKQLLYIPEFRRDLYYRLKNRVINLPNLPDRFLDIPALLQFFIRKNNIKYNRNVKFVDFLLYLFVLTYDWPGNVRELESFIDYSFQHVVNDTLVLEPFFLFFEDHTLTPGFTEFSEERKALQVKLNWVSLKFWGIIKGMESMPKGLKKIWKFRERCTSDPKIEEWIPHSKYIYNSIKVEDLFRSEFLDVLMRAILLQETPGVSEQKKLKSYVDRIRNIYNSYKQVEKIITNVAALRDSRLRQDIFAFPFKIASEEFEKLYVKAYVDLVGRDAKLIGQLTGMSDDWVRKIMKKLTPLPPKDSKNSKNSAG